MGRRQRKQAATGQGSALIDDEMTLAEASEARMVDLEAGVALLNGALIWEREAIVLAFWQALVGDGGPLNVYYTFADGGLHLRWRFGDGPPVAGGLVLPSGPLLPHRR